ncbi:ABC-type bacteriocin/lantibiotic exporter with double-glycine peptidase domain [Kineothrix alysoides]|uniref:ABC-type bacteriocin/lantibiotic exporter with double-glycine peptidase domain n=1 Tax=Kineothrix alysoides TaxID=1469948 RepID=A0A4R1QMN6_9FIRM|nr:cysteine peptidase family C39 domain-containing protein [Kineothrix alysoides]TCL54998.1 ABC-type bacteriocin/lantibiotic exporter with double-glycine peptidase domain [Kineothrix alysoides]
MKVILQTNQSDCLLTCAAMLMDTYKCTVPVYRLVEKVELSMAGSNVLQLRDALGEYGFSVEGYKVEYEKLNSSMLPIIAYVNNGHFIVINKITKNKFIGVDPAIGRIAYSYAEFQGIYSKVVVKIDKARNDVKVKVVKHRELLGFLKNKELIKILSGLLITSVFTQIVAMSYSYMYSAVSKDNSYLNLGILLIAAVVLLGAGSMIQGYLTKKFNVLYEQIYGNRLVDKLVCKNYKFFSFRSNGDLLYRINARGMIKDALLLKIVPSFIALCTVILVQTVLFWKNLFLGGLFLTANVLYLFFYISISKVTYIESNKYTQKVIKLNTTSENIIRTISTIKVLDVSKVFMEKWHSENEEQAERYGQLVILQSIQNVLTNIFTYIVPIVVSIVNIICNREDDIFSQIALLPLLYLVVQNVVTLGQAFNSLYTVLPNIDKTNELLDEKFMQDRERKVEHLDNNEEISVRNMSYYYGSFRCLEDVNLQIKKGKKYAVIGISGSGKSTLLKVLANLFNDYHGTVAFDSANKQKPVYLDQDTSILDGSILENVLFGQQCTNERLARVSQATGLEEIVDRQPLKWATEISKGKNLSRGQEQRICLARCLIKEAGIYLLDEATSNIDVIDEEKIMNNLIGRNGILRDETVFISTHKLSMISYADEVIYIKEGRVYQGIHEQLLQKFPSYGEFFE